MKPCHRLVRGHLGPLFCVLTSVQHAVRDCLDQPRSSHQQAHQQQRQWSHFELETLSLPRSEWRVPRSTATPTSTATSKSARGGGWEPPTRCHHRRRPPRRLPPLWLRGGWTPPIRRHSQDSPHLHRHP